MHTRNNEMIELFRTLACIMIFFIHAQFPGPFGRYVVILGRFAVPYFLMISGYYIYGSNMQAKAQKKLRDTLKIILCGGALCVIWNCIISCLRSGSPTEWILSYMGFHTLFNFVLFNRAVFLNSVFYYFFMLVYIYAFCILVNKSYFTEKHRTIAIAVLTLCGWIINHFTPFEWYYAGNAFFTGIPMFLIGQQLRLHSGFVEKLYGKELVFLCIGMLITFGEYYILPTGDYVFIGQIIVAAMLICYSINHSRLPAPAPIVWFGTNCSLCFIVIHHQVIKTLSVFLDQSQWSFPLIALLVSCILSIGAALIHGKRVSCGRKRESV